MTEPNMTDQTDWDRLDRERAAGIEPEKDPDEGEWDWSRARVRMPSGLSWPAKPRTLAEHIERAVGIALHRMGVRSMRDVRRLRLFVNRKRD